MFCRPCFTTTPSCTSAHVRRWQMTKGQMLPPTRWSSSTSQTELCSALYDGLHLHSEVAPLKRPWLEGSITAHNDDIMAIMIASRVKGISADELHTQMLHRAAALATAAVDASMKVGAMTDVLRREVLQQPILVELLQMLDSKVHVEFGLDHITGEHTVMAVLSDAWSDATWRSAMTDAARAGGIVESLRSVMQLVLEELLHRRKMFVAECEREAQLCVEEVEGWRLDAPYFGTSSVHLRASVRLSGEPPLLHCAVLDDVGSDAYFSIPMAPLCSPRGTTFSHFEEDAAPTKSSARGLRPSALRGLTEMALTHAMAMHVGLLYKMHASQLVGLVVPRHNSSSPGVESFARFAGVDLLLDGWSGLEEVGQPFLQCTSAQPQAHEKPSVWRLAEQHVGWRQAQVVEFVRDGRTIRLLSLISRSSNGRLSTPWSLFASNAAALRVWAPSPPLRRKEAANFRVLHWAATLARAGVVRVDVQSESGVLQCDSSSGAAAHTFALSTVKGWRELGSFALQQPAPVWMPCRTNPADATASVVKSVLAAFVQSNQEAANGHVLPQHDSQLHHQLLVVLNLKNRRHVDAVAHLEYIRGVLAVLVHPDDQDKVPQLRRGAHLFDVWAPTRPLLHKYRLQHPDDDDWVNGLEAPDSSHHEHPLMEVERALHHLQHLVKVPHQTLDDAMSNLLVGNAIAAGKRVSAMCLFEDVWPDCIDCSSQRCIALRWTTERSIPLATAKDDADPPTLAEVALANMPPQLFPHVHLTRQTVRGLTAGLKVLDARDPHRASHIVFKELKQEPSVIRATLLQCGEEQWSAEAGSRWEAALLMLHHIRNQAPQVVPQGHSSFFTRHQESIQRQHNLEAVWHEYDDVANRVSVVGRRGSSVGVGAEVVLASHVCPWTYAPLHAIILYRRLGDETTTHTSTELSNSQQKMELVKRIHEELPLMQVQRLTTPQLLQTKRGWMAELRIPAEVFHFMYPSGREGHDSTDFCLSVISQNKKQAVMALLRRLVELLCYSSLQPTHVALWEQMWSVARSSSVVRVSAPASSSTALVDLIQASLHPLVQAWAGFDGRLEMSLTATFGCVIKFVEHHENCKGSQRSHTLQCCGWGAWPPLVVLVAMGKLVERFGSTEEVPRICSKFVASSTSTLGPSWVAAACSAEQRCILILRIILGASTKIDVQQPSSTARSSLLISVTTLAATHAQAPSSVLIYLDQAHVPTGRSRHRVILAQGSGSSVSAATDAAWMKCWQQLCEALAVDGEEAIRDVEMILRRVQSIVLKPLKT